MVVEIKESEKILAKKNKITQQIIKEEVPEGVLNFAAQGLLPLPSEEIIDILVYLITTESKYKEVAEKTLSGYKVNDLIEIVKKDNLIPETYLYFADVSRYDKRIIQALLYNRAVPNKVFEKVAEVGKEDLLEIIVSNQIRLLNYPPIIDKLLKNPNLSNDQRRRINEFREEFFEKVSVGNPLFRGMKREEEKEVEEEKVVIEEIEEKKGEAKIEEENLPSVEEIISAVKKDEREEVLVEEEQEEAVEEELLKELPAEAETLLAPEERRSKKMISAYNKIMKLTLPEKIQLALLGTREERAILIRDSNKSVAMAVLKSPKLTEVDVEVISTFRQVDPEILQGIANNRKWIKNYNIILNLVKNPKTPVGTALHLLNRITLTDLKILKNNKNVPEIIRRMAQKIIVEKSTTATG